MLVQLWGAIRASDAALAAGDALASRQAIDRLAVWQARELQSCARLAATWLLIEPGTPGERFRKRRALSLYVSLHDPAAPQSPPNLAGGGLAWAPERLDEVAEEAGAWLDGDTG